MPNPSFDLVENPQITDAQATEVSNGLFDDGSGYGINSASNDSLGWFDNALDPTGFVKGFYNDMMGFTSQEREFEQQMKMTQYQNRWNSAQEQMKRAKEAGINPLTAAGGIAGNGISSVASAGGSASPTSAPADAISGFGSMASNAQLAGAQAQSISKSLEPNIQNTIADTFKKYKEAGYTDLQAQGLAIANAYLPAEKFLGIVAMNENIKNLQGQYQNLLKDIEVKDARIKEIDKHIDQMGASISLMEKQALEAEKHALFMESQTMEQNWFNQKRSELGIDPKSPLENQLFMMGVTGNPNYSQGLQIVYDNQYYSHLGRLDPQMEYDWNSPPKTMFEFISKGVANIKEKFNTRISNDRKLISDLSQVPEKMSELNNTLRNSYMQYQDQLNHQKTMLNLMKADCFDDNGKMIDPDSYARITKEYRELEKMPKTFNEYKKYVYSK